MKRFLAGATLCLAFAMTAAAQQSSADAPATKEDIQKYLGVTHSRKMMAQMLDAMTKPMHQMIHEQYLKDQDKLPADLEARMTKMLDDSMKSFPRNEILDSMVPVYQKHLTKGDLDALVVFYGSPTGQKMLREMPAMIGEAMQAMMPILRKQMEAMPQQIQQELAEMVKDSDQKASPDSKATVN
jgi:uncharacterized protein